MSLDEYRRKRSFKKTPEPPPGSPKSPSAEKPEATAQPARFYIQRHHARRLHYDLRLEAAGVLKSWAVPKGPTLDPGEKRLAVLVEDHPIDYGNFEGTIPEGNYGAGSVVVWDRGTYELIGEESFEQQMERGDLKFSLHGHKLMGAFALARMKDRGKGNEWLLIKKKDFAAKPGWNAEDDTSSVVERKVDAAAIPGAKLAEMPAEISPMLAAPVSAAPEGWEWLFELKWDGVRALCFLDKSGIRMSSRTGKKIEKQYPELARAADYVAAESVVLDGELVVLDAQGRPNFSLLQSRIGAVPSAAAQLARSQPVNYFVFDLLYLNGYDLRDVPLAERKRLLQAVLRPNSTIRYSEHYAGNGGPLLQFAREHEMEGIVAKHAASRYESRRSGAWQKIKIVKQQDCVICGLTAVDREYFGSLALGVYEGDELVYAGNVGSGFDQQLLKNTYELLQPLKTKQCPFAQEPKMMGETVWVKPELVCAVRFSSWTNEGRLRAPVFFGIRTDVNPRDCVREQELEAGTEAADVPAQPHRLLPPKAAEVALTIEGKSLKFTNLNKIFYPKQGYTKRDIINYYDAVAHLILPYLQDRPLSLKRYPNGIEGDYFFQKNAPTSFPSWLRTEAIPSDHEGGITNFVIANDRASLLYLANLGCIDQNPLMGRVGSLENPDFMLIDLDPSDCGFDRIVEAALLVQQKLTLLGLQGCPKTTGGDGLHVYVPLDTRYSYDQVRTFAEILSRLLSHERPDLFTTPRTVTKREKGKVYFDYLQIASWKNIAAPYVLRAYPGAPVATPLMWTEVTKGLSPAQFHLGNALERFARVGDLFEPVLKLKQTLEEALEKLGALVREPARG
ncbi:MAG TPA: DNA ligase D [Terriglobales bacterium]|nr:DNA ligase D [Terriglobales bacterium]